MCVMRMCFDESLSLHNIPLFCIHLYGFIPGTTPRQITTRQIRP